MASSYTSLLGFVLPVTGELSGSWGSVWNDSGTSLIDAAISGTTSLTTDADVTLTTTDGVANQARQAILLWTASGSTTRNITAPAQSKAYFVVNKTSGTQSIVIRGAGPTTGVTVRAGQQSLVVWDGADFVEVASGDVDGPSSATDNAIARFDGTTGKLIQNSVVTIADTTGNMAGVGTLGVGAITTSGALTYGGVTLNNAVTGTGDMVLSTSPTLVTPALGTPSALVGTNITGTAAGLTAGNVTTNANLTGAITSTGNATVLGSFSSANLAGALTDETGTGSAVFANSPTLVTPALGTPASGTVTNLTGTASININGTVGATTPTTGVFTTITADNIIAPNVATIGQFSWDNSATTTPVAKPVVTPSADLLASIQGRMRGCLLLDNGQVNYYLKATDWTQKDDGSASVLTGADGMVMVEVPAFYVQNGSTGTLWKPVISATPLSGYDLHPAFIKDGAQVPYRYYSAYDACVDKTQAITGATAANPVVITSNNHGLQTGGTCFISGVVGMTEINDRTFTVTRVDANTFSLDGEDGTLHTAYTSGGTLAAYISGGNLDNATALVDLTATTGSKLACVSGVYPMGGLTRGEFRTLAKNRGTGWRMGDFTLWSAIGILLAVEAQTLNSQGVYGAGNTGGGYIARSSDQNDSPHTIAGAGNALGNGSTDTTSGAAVNAKPGTSYCKYRGIENFWGNANNWTDGINIFSEGDTAGDKVFAYWNNNSAEFADDTETNYGLLGEIANTLNNTRYATQFAPTTTWGLVPTAVSTTSSHGTTDFYFTNSGWRVLRVGGNALDGGAAGAFAFSGDAASSLRNRARGARLAY